MVEHARFIYDGWMPIADWSIENVRNSIKNLDKILSLFAIQERIWFTWEPKYFPSQQHPSSQKIELEHLNEITELNRMLDALNEEDSKVFYRSIAWLSQSLILPQPAARFLFCIVSIESLANYIEREAKEDSIFYKIRTSHRRTKEEREKCIDAYIKNICKKGRIHTIINAYNDCVLSLTNMLKRHLSKVMSDDPESLKLLFEKGEEDSLYSIRHKIAHGSLDILSDTERQRIADRIYEIERITRKYLNKISTIILKKPPFQHSMIKSMAIPMTEVISSHEGMYKGPTHMAEFYTYISET